MRPGRVEVLEIAVALISVRRDDCQSGPTQTVPVEFPTLAGLFHIKVGAQVLGSDEGDVGIWGRAITEWLRRREGGIPVRALYLVLGAAAAATRGVGPERQIDVVGEPHA